MDWLWHDGEAGRETALATVGTWGAEVTQPLVLSLFPGIGLLDMAFEEEGFCVVRGPDLLWGGDIRRFHPPAGKFAGVIGGPPCLLWAATNSFPRATPPVNLIPEFERCVRETQPDWFMMENVKRAPLPDAPGYMTQDRLVKDFHVGGQTLRQRRFSFGSRMPELSEGTQRLPRFAIEGLALHTTDPKRTVTAGGAQYKRDGTPYRNRAGKMSHYGGKTDWGFQLGKRHQGLPDDFDLPPFTVRAKVEAIGNGVPLAMGRAVARAVKRAMYSELVEAVS